MPMFFKPFLSPIMRYKYLDLLSVIFVTTLLVSNIIASKIGAFGSLFLPVAVVVFPLSYVVADILTEVYGYAAMRRVIWMGFFCNLLAVAMYFIALKIPAAPFYQDQSAFALVFGAAPRILLASFVAYLFGSFTNAFILAKLKVRTEGRLLWLRTIVSTLIGEGLDSVIFITIAFGGVFPTEQIGTLILTQWMFKSVFEIIVTPLTYVVVAKLKKSEGVDHFDRTTRFQPFSFSHAD